MMMSSVMWEVWEHLTVMTPIITREGISGDLIEGIVNLFWGFGDWGGGGREKEERERVGDSCGSGRVRR